MLMIDLSARSKKKKKKREGPQRGLMDIWGGYEEGLVVTVSEADMVRWKDTPESPRKTTKIPQKTNAQNSTQEVHDFVV